MSIWQLGLKYRPNGMLQTNLSWKSQYLKVLVETPVIVARSS